MWHTVQVWRIVQVRYRTWRLIVATPEEGDGAVSGRCGGVDRTGSDPGEKRCSGETHRTGVTHDVQVKLSSVVMLSVLSTWKLVHATSILESWILLPNSIKIDPYNFSYTVSKLVHFLRHSVYRLFAENLHFQFMSFFHYINWQVFQFQLLFWLYFIFQLQLRLAESYFSVIWPFEFSYS